MNQLPPKAPPPLKKDHQHMITLDNKTAQHIVRGMLADHERLPDQLAICFREARPGRDADDSRPGSGGFGALKVKILDQFEESNSNDGMPLIVDDALGLVKRSRAAAAAAILFADREIAHQRRASARAIEACLSASRRVAIFDGRAIAMGGSARLAAEHMRQHGVSFADAYFSIFGRNPRA